VMAEVGSKDPLTRRIYQSYIEFRSRCTPWSDIAERAFLNARGLPFPYGGKA
jgi:TRAP-type mannitol/chloroaromatic compound transport system substrate-binding protein